jgi:hypothetical protein
VYFATEAGPGALGDSAGAALAEGAGSGAAAVEADGAADVGGGGAAGGGASPPQEGSVSARASETAEAERIMVSLLGAPLYHKKAAARQKRIRWKMLSGGRA